jgi:branched-chain amino acid transport system ATP-binding protein
MIVEVDHITACYGALTALQDITLRLEPGGRLGIFGHNGAGKSTLLRCMIGAHTVAAGDVRLDGKPVEPGKVSETIRRGVALVPQGHNVFPNLSVEKNLRIAGLLFDENFLSEVLAVFPVLKDRLKQRASSMSGGEQQMLALGMALMTQPKWLLLDEPSTGLAPVIVRNVMVQLRKINESFGTGLVVVEQNVPVTLKLVYDALILKSGRVVYQGNAAELASKSDLWEWF